MLRGSATIDYWADDVEVAKRWYTELLGVAVLRAARTRWPSCLRRVRIGDYQNELGLVDRAWAPADAPTEPGGAVLYWHVDDIEASFAKLLSMGAAEYQPATRGL